MISTRRLPTVAFIAVVAALGLAACVSPAAPTAPAPASTVTTGQAAPAATTAAGQAAPIATVAAGQAAPAATSTAGQTSPAQSATTKLNLNTATREQFMAVPGVGDRMVREFFEYRPYSSIQQFRREIGKYVSQDQVAAYEQYVFVPVNPNTADAETLRQLPGVDANIATQLVTSRPYASNDAFLARLGQLVAANQAAAARAYLSS